MLILWSNEKGNSTEVLDKNLGYIKYFLHFYEQLPVLFRHVTEIKVTVKSLQNIKNHQYKG